MKIPFHKPFITESDINEVVDTVKSGWLTMGSKTVQLEKEFADYLGGSLNAIALNSCTSALHLALKAIDLKPGQEVIVPTMTFTATAEVVCYFDAKPVFVDIDPITNNINVSEIEKAITKSTRAIIPVHYGGQPCDMDKIKEIADTHNLYVIEDAAHCFPATYQNKLIGTISDMTCFSFYATKPLAAGEGGMVTTKNDLWADRIRILRLHGISKDAWKRYTGEGSWYYEVLEVGYKYNMSDLHASIALSQLKKIDDMWHKRMDIFDTYTSEFNDNESLITPFIKEGRISSYHLYSLKIKPEALKIDRSEFIIELNKMGIGTSVHFIPLHRQPYYKNRFLYNESNFPNAEWVYERIISLPIYPGLCDNELDYIINAVNYVCKKFKK